MAVRKEEKDEPAGATRETRVVPVEVSRLGRFNLEGPDAGSRGDWSLESSDNTADHATVLKAASLLRHSDIPVAFPTETVYGLGADATRSAAVQGIYKAKQRPLDNPLIVHISSLAQLRTLLAPTGKGEGDGAQDPVPQIYHSLIQRYWPGPLTILLPLPTKPSPFAPEVTAGLSTVGVRMPSSPLALALIQAAGVPLAAPSANASTKPSPTTAAHVLQDLDGRIDLILDGGPCNVGVESTVVDGLHYPPLILRPGGVSIEMLRQCPGWEDVQVGYHDGAQNEAPRAPGMKYKHYSPKARVLLYRDLDRDLLSSLSAGASSIGIIQTSNKALDVLKSEADQILVTGSHQHASFLSCQYTISLRGNQPDTVTVWQIHLGPTVTDVARGLFSALRELDSRGVSVIFVESVDERKGDAAAAVMNRLRKAAESEISL